MPSRQRSRSGSVNGAGVQYDNVSSGLTATNIQDAIDELAGGGGGGGAVDSVFGRTGAVGAQTGDYSYDQVTDAQRDFVAVLDDTATVAEINAALAAANHAGGGIVHLKAGLYLLDASIEMEGYNNVTLEGAGDGTILQPQAGITWTNSSVINALGDGKAFSVAINNISSNDTSITATTPANIASILPGDWITIQGTDLDGLQDSEAHFLSKVTTGTGQMGLVSKVLRTMTSVNASDITRGGVANKFRNFKLDMSLTDKVGSHWGLYINNTYANRVENVTFVDATLNGHTFLRMNTSPYTVVEKCRFTNAQSQMIGMSVGIGAVFKDCVFDKIATDPVFNLSYVPSDVKIINCVFRNCNDDGFKMSNINGSGKRIQLIGNSFSNCVGNGIQLVGGAGHVVEGNTFHGIGNGAASVLLNNTRGASVIGNTMENGGLVDVWLSGSNCVYNTVKGNTFRQNTNRITNGAQLAAIYCDNAQNNDLTGNTYDGTSGSYYSFNGTTPGNQTDEYRTFTPGYTLVGGSGNTVAQYTTNVGRYIQRGKIVHVEIELRGDGGAEGAGTGGIYVTLPVACSASANSFYFPCGYLQNGTSHWTVLGALNLGTAQIQLSYLTGTTLGDFTGASQDQTSRVINLNFTYEAA